MGRVGLIAILLAALTSGLHAADNFAAQELERYLNQMSPGGKSNLTNDVRIDPALNLDGREMYKIAINERGFTITATNLNLALTGVYHLLDNAGCRFLAPNLDFYKGASEYLPPHMGVITFSGSMMWSPALKFRKIYVEEGHSHTPENLTRIVEWMPKVGYNTLVVPADYQGHHRVMWDNFRKAVAPECQKRGITIEVGGHGYQNFLNADMEDGKLFAQHPEFFGQDEKGVRSKVPNRVFCTSNPAAVDYLIKNFTAYVKERPEIQIYDFWPPDGAKWCECENCKKLGTPSDRQALLIHVVREQVAPVRPDLRLEVLAYHTSVTPPEHATLDQDVLLDFCPINQQFDHAINDPQAPKNVDYVNGLTAWRKAFAGDISIYSYYRKYAWDSLPVIIPHYMQKDLQWYAKLPVQGVSTYAEPGDWGTYELNHYVLAALAWDPNADVDAIVKKFCAARYGEFADQAQTVLLTLEDITRNTSSIPNSALKSAEAIEADRGRATRLADAMATCAGKASDPAIKRSLERLGLMCTYVQRDLDIQHLRATSADKEQIKTKADELHAWLVEHADDGVFLIKDQRISPARMQRRYGTSTKPAAQG